ncbi:MAG TPA: IMP dehydrogenase, partial [Patescibacteria group bacterium]|nr:IMP dehydrogenase [Patescibacteria group bacterium]
MRIEEDVKLDFKDVLIRPKRSTLASRKEVDISREFPFRWSNRTFEGVPIIAANMDGVGTMAMAKTFAKMGHGMTVALHKHYPLEDLLKFYKDHGSKNVWYSIGVSEA